MFNNLKNYFFVFLTILPFVVNVNLLFSQPSLQKELDAIFGNLKLSNQTEKLNRFFEIYWDYQMRTYPTFATYMGVSDYNHRWIDISLEAYDQRNEDLRTFTKAIKKFDRSKLDDTSRLNFDLFKRTIDTNIESIPYKNEYMPVNQMGGFHLSVPRVLKMMPASNLKDYENILARLGGVPAQIDQIIVLLEKGLAEGITPPKITLRDIPQTIENLIAAETEESVFFTPFKKFPEMIGPDKQNELKQKAKIVIIEKVYPAYQKLHDYFVEKYLPRTRDPIGLSSLPNGKVWYEYNIKYYTTTNLTAKEIHEIGLKEVKRIRNEMESIIKSTGFKGSFSEFTEFLRTDPQFFFDTSDELLAAYRDIAKRIDPELVKLFGKLPRLPYGVIAVPSYSEKSQTTAYYNGGSLEAGRPGYFYANTYDLKSRPKWEMEALTIHEAVPGHHLQIALAQEMENVPKFRNMSSYTAFVEGWGLYSESLGEELGMYKDPYSKFGQLTYEMWRAIRLVVDTGMHAFGWTRQQAIDYFIQNSAKTEHDITVEIDRYIVWPGQALAYKIGELKIKEMRKKASDALGEKFDIRGFHDAVLGNGAVPLDLLELQINEWIESQKSKN